MKHVRNRTCLRIVAVILLLFTVFLSGCSEMVQQPEPQISADGPGEVPAYEVTEAEKLMMAKVVWAESRGEPFEGQVAVAAVILNRREAGGHFGKTIKEVITKKYQFASIKTIKDEIITEQKERISLEAVEQAVYGYDPTRVVFPNGAKYFYAHKRISKKALESRKGIKKLVIGNHTFHDSFAKKSKK